MTRFSVLVSGMAALLVLTMVTSVYASELPDHAGEAVMSQDVRAARQDRLAGADRYGTAITVTQLLHRDHTVDVVYIASGDNYPDAISVTSLMALSNTTNRQAAVLLSPKAGLTPEVLAEVRRLLKPEGTIRLVGGEEALSTNVEYQLSTLVPEGKPRRLAGPTRVETALVIADEVRVLTTVSEVIITPAQNYGIGMVSSALAGKRNAVHLVAPETRDGGLHPAVAEWIARTKPKKVTILGPEPFLTSFTYSTLERITDQDELNLTSFPCKPGYGTCNPPETHAATDAQVIAEKVVNQHFQGVEDYVMVSYAGAADGLAAGQFAVSKLAPILPIKNGAPGDDRYGYLIKQTSGRPLITLWAIGGERVINQRGIEQVAKAFES
ncbi:cell wall-binding repeat-containing protein [Stomatohabitans albus]|uniref:cell wall-binding repeat-containing protein n=1 Tax=Stomatohabitans albus TaxID=3110766 RepID=UPI00300D2B39